MLYAAERFAPLLPGMFNSIAEQLPSSEVHHMVKLLQAWRREAILPQQQLDNLEGLVPGLTAAGAAAGAGIAGADVGYEGSDTAGDVSNSLCRVVEEKECGHA
eukprot:GHUV01025191.1.p1 GENE.GHUV01025191.1~~GHUV01025191.1.p1  ORF type:complete len:103 (-),score=39.87 GHUV01025191.1:104-412(-)